MTDYSKEDKQELINKVLQQQKDILSDPRYAVDTTTGQIKQMLDISSIYDNIPTDATIKDTMYDLTIYTKKLKPYLDRDYKNNIDKLNADILSFNTDFRVFYLTTANIINCYQESNKIQIASIYADSISVLTYDKYNDIGYDAFINADSIGFLESRDLEDIKNALKQQKDKNIKYLIYNIVYNNLIDTLNKSIQEHEQYYKTLDKRLTDIYNKIYKIIDKFTLYSEVKYTDIVNVEIQQPKSNIYPLALQDTFNKMHNLGVYNSIYNKDRINIKIKLDLDIKTDDFRENIIFYDYLLKKQIPLIPIDYLIFIACTELNAYNKSLSGIHANIPITIQDIIRYITDNDKYKRSKRDNAKLYQYIIDRLTLWSKLMVDTIYTTNGKVLKLYDKPMALLDNYYYNDPLNKNQDSYIIGASALLTLIAQLEKITNKPYLASYKRVKELMNDNQNNDINTLNIKAFITPKILQKTNSKNNDAIYQPKISLEDMYKSLAYIKGRELNKTEKKRARDTALKYLDHLQDINIIQAYDTKPLIQNGKNQLTKQQKKIDYIYVRANKTS